MTQRKLIASYRSKLADIPLGLDIMARAQFWEGAAGYLPFHKIRGVNAPSALLGLIRKLMEEVNPALVAGDSALEGTDGQSIWYSPGNTRLWLGTFKLAEKIVTRMGMEGADVLQEDMARDDKLGSVFYSAGKQIAKGMSEQLQSGQVLPSDAQVVTRRFIARHCLDAIRTMKNRQRLEMENGGDIVQMTTETELDASDWQVVIDRLLNDPTHPLAKQFFDWLKSYASRMKSPVLVAYLDAVMSGNGADQGQIAQSMGVSDAALSMAKKNFFTHIASLLAGSNNAQKPPAILNILSDAQFLYQLLKGKVRGPVASVSEEDLLRSKVIRLAHTKPEFRELLLPLVTRK